MMELSYHDYRVSKGFWIGDADLPPGKRVMVMWSVVSDLLTAAENPDWPQMQAAFFPES